jgi:hypothetical protein
MAKKTKHFSITKINWLMLLREIIIVYSENHMEPINTKFRMLIKTGGTYGYHWCLKRLSI